MTEQNPPEQPEKPAEKPTRSTKPKVGDVVQISEGRYALVVGTEKVKHQHRDSNDQPTDSVVREHPLVIDLGVARRHEVETL